MPAAKPKVAALPQKGLTPPSHPAKSPASKSAAPKSAANALAREVNTTSQANRKRAEALLNEIGRRMQRIAEDFYDIGQALLELQKKKLYLSLGYKSFAEMLAARRVMSPAQANKLIKIVSTLPRDRALSVGSEKAALLAAYAEATPEPDTAEWLLDQGKLPSGKSLAQASTREIAEASKKVRAVGAKKKAKSPEEAAALAGARKAQAALRKRGARGATAEAIKRGGE
ncbi:MAG: hypothetical protein IPK82_43570 [Polyangiaceae bacterium]|nr:hypothetical protein [Polyangiaceae bacterium]